MKHTTLSRFASLAASAALALSLAACGSTSRSTYSAAVSNDTAALSSQDAGDYEYYSAESAAPGEGSSFSPDDLTSSMLDPSTVESSRKIVYNASVRMETTDYDTTRAALQEAVTAANGYLESTDQGGSKDSGSRYTYYTARIPAENYRSFLTAAGEAGNVTSLNESAQDITAEYVDVEARLKALNDQRDRLNALADKAETTADLLEIENQLSDVQYQLESYTGQMRLMDNQVRYSTVDISLQEVRVLTPTATTFGEKFVALAMLLFAFTTVLGWSQYGTKAVEYLFGEKATKIYKVIFVVMILSGAVMTSSLAWDISDTFNGLMMPVSYTHLTLPTT